MRTVREVAQLTGVSVRTLQYYDEIGVFKPTVVTAAGYRLYDDEALKTLQQLLFFKELDFPLKYIKEIMENPDFDKIEAFRKQKKLLKAKRDRLTELLKLLDKLEKGESCMSFKEFDLSGYLQVLEEFKTENRESVIKYWGSMEEFERFMEKVRTDEDKVGALAVKQYGSIENYTAAMKESLANFTGNMEAMERMKTDGTVERNRYLGEQLVKDITKDPKSREIQSIVKELVVLGENNGPKIDKGENYWNMILDYYLHNDSFRQIYDKAHGTGASEFVGKAYQYYFDTNKKGND